MPKTNEYWEKIAYIQTKITTFTVKLVMSSTLSILCAQFYSHLFSLTNQQTQSTICTLPIVLFLYASSSYLLALNRR